MMKTSGYGSNCEASCVGSCGNGWDTRGNRCFYLSKKERTWLYAQDWCQRNGGHLASVTDEQDHNFLTEKGVQVWIGGIREKGNETLVWTDCSPWSFTNWGGGEPKEDLKEDGCVAYIAHSKTWSVDTCTTKRRFLCSATTCSGKNQFSTKYLTNYLQMMFLQFKRTTAAQTTAHQAVILGGRSSMDSATSGARRSCSGRRLR